MFLVLIAAGFGSLIEWSKSSKINKSVVLGVGIFIALLAFNLGMQLGANLGPDENSNWETAWDFLKTDTPELSIVGTWWDPGHMIAGLADRRVYADGAHCQLGADGENACLYTINDRITDLGNIMTTTNETESLELIKKYQGTSPKAYWIASDDLIGKFRWLQYFGTGCDGTGQYTPNGQQICPLYVQLSQTSQKIDENGNVVFLTYEYRDYLGNLQFTIYVYNSQLPIPLFVESINVALFEEFVYYNGTDTIQVRFNEDEISQLITALKPLESQLNARFTNTTIPRTMWLPRHYQYVVMVPPTLRNSVFTKMFMLEGQGLDHFEQVFRNEQVKIYEVIP
jgi:hypothetical protein